MRYVAEALPWPQHPALHLGLLGASLLVMLATMLGWLVEAWLRPGRDAPPAQARLARLAAGAAIAALVPALAGIAALGLLDDLSWLAGSAAVAAPKALFSAGAAATLATVGYAGVAWRNRWWSLPHRVHFSAVAVALTVFVAVASEYDLVGWPLVSCA